MNRIDCMKTENFFRELNRMCDCNECKDCSINKIYGACSLGIIGCKCWDLIDMVQKWSDEHPVKTRMDDLKEKYPKAMINTQGYPAVCARALGYCDNCEEHCCRDCWNVPLDA